jgi:purine catabolism regulator
MPSAATTSPISATVWQNYAPLLMLRGAMMVGVVPLDPDLLQQVAIRLAPGCGVGVSTPLTVNSPVAESMRQAQLAVARAHEHRRSIARYGDDDERGGDFLPHNVEDVRRMVRRTLGPLIGYDRANDGDLVDSVRVFLRHNGVWQASADELNIHRQTLVYRLKKVEQLTGLKPTTTEGSALLWLALTAADRAELPLDDLLVDQR